MTSTWIAIPECRVTSEFRDMGELTHSSKWIKCQISPAATPGFHKSKPFTHSLKVRTGKAPDVVAGIFR